MSAQTARRARQGDPLAGPRQRYFNGNLLIQQVRGSAGRDAGQLDGLRSLKLGKVGRSAICDTEHAAVRGQLHELAFMLAVAPLTVDAVPFAQSRVIPGLRVAADASSASWSCETANDGFVRAARRDEGGMLAWSSALPVATVLRRIRRLLPPVSDHEAMVVLRGAQTVPRDSPALFDWLASNPSDAVFARLEFEGLSLVWQRAVYPGHVDHTFLPGRVALEGHVGSKLIEQLLTLTATPEVGAEAATVSKAVVDLVG